MQFTPLDVDYQWEKRAKIRTWLDELKKPKVIPREKHPSNFSFKPATFDLPHSIPFASKDSHLGFGKFMGRNPFDLCIKPSIFSSLPSFPFFSSSNPFLVENSCTVGEDVVATRTDATIVARSHIVTPPIDVEDGDVRADIGNDVVASINPPFTTSSYFFSHLPQLELTSCIGK